MGAMSSSGPRVPTRHWPRRSFLISLLSAAAVLLVPSVTLAASPSGQSRAVVAARPVAVGSGAGDLAFDAGTHSLYTVDQGGSISVLDTGRCNADAARGCRTDRVGTISLPRGSGPRGIAIDTATDTVYVADRSVNEVSVINGATCNATDRWGCTPTSTLLADPSGPPMAKAVRVGAFPDGIAVDSGTDTVYVTNQGDAGHPGDTVSVIDGARCNGVHSSGCDLLATLSVGRGPGWIALDEATQTGYTVNQMAGTVSVINLATCNATDISGCGQKTPTITVGASPFVLTIDQELHTAYVASNRDHTVSVIDLDAVSCAAAATSGCRTVSRTPGIGAEPSGAAVDTANRSVYVVNRDPATVSVIDAATCNANDRAGCARPVATIHVGADPAGVAIDQTTNTVYVANNEGATVSVIDAAICNATEHAGCDRIRATVTVGRNPFGIGIDQ
jgi:YVTN family beta-propeller protein